MGSRRRVLRGGTTCARCAASQSGACAPQGTKHALHLAAVRERESVTKYERRTELLGALLRSERSVRDVTFDAARQLNEEARALVPQRVRF
eukprot:2378725-Pleurochrysis_carterae.AAC.1